MATEAELRYIITVQDRELKELKRELAATGKVAGEEIPKGVQRSRKSLDKLNRTVNIVGAALVAGIVVGGKKAIDASSDLNEAASATEVTFGKSARSILDWSKDTTDAFAAVDFLSAAKTFGGFGKAAGVAEEDLAGFAKKLIDASQDMASFHNADPSEVLENLRSGLSGETEPLRKYQIFMNEATIAQEAMRLGLVKHGEELTEQDKIRARASFILRNLGDAEGDWSRTRLEAANVSRTATANTQDMAAALGEGLLPLYTQALKLGLKMIEFTTEHTTATKALVVGTLALVAGLKAYVIASKTYTAAVTTGTLTNKLLNSTLRAQRVLLATSIIGALVLLGIALVVAWKKSDRFREIVYAAIDVVKDIFFDLRDAGFALRDGLVRVWDRIKGAVLGAVDFILGVFDKYLAGIELILKVMGKMPGPLGAPFRKMAEAVGGARARVDELRGAVRDLKGKRVNVTVDFSLRAQAAKPREGFVGRGGGDLHAGDLRGMVNGIVTDGIVGHVNRNPSLLSGLFGSARSDLDPRLWQEAGLAAAMGLTVGSTYRPGATVRGSGSRSDHSFYPSKAFDAFGSASNMRAFALAVAGLPGVDTVIYSGLGRGGGLWKGAWGPILSQTTWNDHFDHVHVDTFDQGGWLAPRSVTLAINRTNMWEPVGPPGGGGGNVYVFQFPNYAGDKRELAKMVRGEFEKFERRNARRT